MALCWKRVVLTCCVIAAAVGTERGERVGERLIWLLPTRLSDKRRDRGNK